ncbi:MAG: helix-turn-helix transcriptional regulator [Magnetospirillum sp.]|nr:helix-turn-helix transcriptional regulator [Magnetospirillum sp.]
MPSAETIGGRIRQVRGSRSQADFASELAVHKETLGKYERDQMIPGADFVGRVCQQFGVSADWLLTGVEPPRSAAPSADSDRLDEELNARVVDGIARLYKEMGVGLSPMDLGRLAARVYSDLVADFTPDERLAGLKGILAQMRRQLREPPAEGKQSA